MSRDYAHNKRKRTEPTSSSSSSSSTVMMSCNDTTEVRTHFRCVIPSGQATFSVLVPQHYLEDTRRRFYFDELHLTPDYYSLDAERRKLDADPELERVIERTVQIKVNFHDHKTVYGPEYVNSATTVNTADLMAKINEHFDTKKPSAAIITPFFIDWVDISQIPHSEPKVHVPSLANIYYGVDYNAALHKDVLPDLVRDIKNVNNFKLPSEESPLNEDFAFLDRIRLRLWMAPHTKAVFSNVDVFVKDLGFDEVQMGRIINKQHHITNSSAYCLAVATATAAPLFRINKDTKTLKFSMWPSAPFLSGRIKQINIVQRDFLDDNKLITTLIQAFKQTSRSLNLKFSIAFDKTERKYLINFADPAIAIMKIHCDAEFAHRLGYGYTTEIMRGMQPQAIKDRNNNEDAQKRALTVVYDTGPIICTLDQVSSNTTSGSLYHTMAALYPKLSGTLSMPRPVCQCSQSTASSNAVQLCAATHTSASNVPITFRLLRIYDDQSTDDFAWTCDGYAYGVLQGICPLAAASHAPGRV